jgi:hypothetical protein
MVGFFVDWERRGGIYHDLFRKESRFCNDLVGTLQKVQQIVDFGEIQQFLDGGVPFPNRVDVAGKDPFLVHDMGRHFPLRRHGHIDVQVHKSH